MKKSEINAADLIPRLREEFGYSPAGAKRVADKLAASTLAVKAAFLRWWQTDVLDAEMEIEGYTLKRLMDEHSMKPIAAFLTLDWLAREPKAALASLVRGHDRVK